MSRLLPDGIDAFPAELLREATAGLPDPGQRMIEVGSQHPGINRGENVNLAGVVDRLRASEEQEKQWLSIGYSGDGGAKASEGQAFWDGLAGMTLGGILCKESSRGRNDAFLADLSLHDFRCAKIDVAAANVVFRNLTVARMEIAPLGRVHFENCTIGRLDIVGNHEADLSFLGGSILCFTFDEEMQARSIDFSGVRIASRRRRGRAADDKAFPNWLFLDAVTFRRLHQWAQEKEDAKLAHQMRGHQLSVDYYLAGRAEKPFLWLWWLFGNYGLSLWRPLLWLAALVLGFATLLYCSGTVAADAALPVGEGVLAQDALGWRDVLMGQDRLARLSRALVGATEAVFSPVNVFSIRKLVLPQQWWVAVLQVFYSYLCLGLIFLFGFSIRRRFKV